MSDNLQKNDKITIELTEKEARACWHSLKTMVDNNIPAPTELHLLFGAMETLARAIDASSQGIELKPKLELTV